MAPAIERIGLEETREIINIPMEKVMKEGKRSFIFPHILILPGRKSLMETAKIDAVVKKTPTVVFTSLTQRGVKVFTVETANPRRDVRRRIVGNPLFFKGSKKLSFPSFIRFFTSGIPKRKKMVTQEIAKAETKKQVKPNFSIIFSPKKGIKIFGKRNETEISPRTPALFSSLEKMTDNKRTERRIAEREKPWKILIM